MGEGRVRRGWDERQKGGKFCGGLLINKNYAMLLWGKQAATRRGGRKVNCGGVGADIVTDKKIKINAVQTLALSCYGFMGMFACCVCAFMALQVRWTANEQSFGVDVTCKSSSLSFITKQSQATCERLPKRGLLFLMPSVIQAEFDVDWWRSDLLLEHSPCRRCTLLDFE